MIIWTLESTARSWITTAFGADEFTAQAGS